MKHIRQTLFELMYEDTYSSIYHSIRNVDFSSETNGLFLPVIVDAVRSVKDEIDEDLVVHQ